MCVFGCVSVFGCISIRHIVVIEDQNCVVTCMSPGLTSLSAERRTNQYFVLKLCWPSAPPSSSILVKYNSPAGILAYLLDCWAHAQSSLCLQDIADFPPAFLLWKSLPCLGCCVLLKIPHQRSNLVSSTVQEPQYIPHEAGMGNSFPPHWTQSCITAPSSTSISPVSPQAWHTKTFHLTDLCI